jgi:hypothetical protein
MGFLSRIVEAKLRQTFVAKAFEAGLHGDPPPQRLLEDVQEISDAAYEKGQKAALVKLGKTIRDRLEE